MGGLGVKPHPVVCTEIGVATYGANDLPELTPADISGPLWASFLRNGFSHGHVRLLLRGLSAVVQGGACESWRVDRGEFGSRGLTGLHHAVWLSESVRRCWSRIGSCGCVGLFRRN